MFYLFGGLEFKVSDNGDISQLPEMIFSNNRDGKNPGTGIVALSFGTVQSHKITFSHTYTVCEM